jgi:UDPglucose 6-dehydrogenase
MAAEKGRHPQLLYTVMEINDDRREMVIAHIKEMVGNLDGKVIGLLGLSFKPNTDDMRDAPSITIAEKLQEAGAIVRAYDPVAMDVAQPLLPGVEMMPDPYTMAQGCDALVVVTEWNEFKQLDRARLRDLMRQPVLYDGRNIYEPDEMVRSGFIYRGVGRGYNAMTLEKGAGHTILPPTE